MRLFHRKRKQDLNSETQHDGRVEAVINYTTTKEAAQVAKEANARLKQQLADDAFTIKIYLAAGGQQRGDTT